MILGFKTKFPWGKPTNFKEKILCLEGFVPKIHTLRENFRFKPGMVINFATGVRTKHYNEFKRDTCKSTQIVVIVNIPFSGIPYIFIDGKLLSLRERDRFKSNDGFDTIEDFSLWFYKPVYILQLVHWTEYKY